MYSTLIFINMVHYLQVGLNLFKPFQKFGTFEKV